jgi:hypothetical protein
MMMMIQKCSRKDEYNYNVQADDRLLCEMQVTDNFCKEDEAACSVIPTYREVLY